MVAYELNAGEGAAGLRRLAGEELRSAAAQLGGARVATRGVAVHEARKSVKKTRAILRLARSGLGALYPAENRRLRDIGRRLARYRDAGVLIDAFDGLRRKYAGELKPGRLAGIRRGLVAARKRTERAPAVRRILQRTAAALEAAAARTQRWRLPEGGPESLADGLDAGYRRARKAFRKAARSGRSADYHEWRKRVKDQWYHLRLLQNSWTGDTAEYEKGLRDLQTWLGDEHDLTVLAETLRAHPAAFGAAADVELCLTLISRCRKELRATALAHSGRLYEKKSRQPL